MDIYTPPGVKVRFDGNVTKDQIRWGCHTDPSSLLHEGEEYVVDHTEVRSSHTRVFLKEFPGKHFNSVWFSNVVNGGVKWRKHQ